MKQHLLASLVVFGCVSAGAAVAQPISQMPDYQTIGSSRGDYMNMGERYADKFGRSKPNRPGQVRFDAAAEAQTLISSSLIRIQAFCTANTVSSTNAENRLKQCKFDNLRRTAKEFQEKVWDSGDQMRGKWGGGHLN